MYYFVALGNPGTKYQMTRHNVGFLALQFFAEKINLPKTTKSAKYLGEVTSGIVQNVDVSVLYPDTFMNHSGSAVKKLVPSAEIDSLVVVYDDVALPLGEIRVSFGRGHGGHNGIRSIIDSMKTKDFIRVRIGVAQTGFWTGKLKIKTGDALAKFVLSDFNKGEQEKLDKEIFPRVNEILLSILKDGCDKTMNKFN